MDEYIERSLALKNKSELGSYYDGLGEKVTVYGVSVEYIRKIPAADVAPVVHGRWENIQGGFWKMGTCSVCGERFSTDGAKYCPNCGAKMDAEVIDNVRQKE